MTSRRAAKSPRRRVRGVGHTREPIFVDANVILRLCLNDHADQAQAAKQLISHAQEGKLELVLSALTCVEIVWVLEKQYGYERTRITDVLTLLLARPGFVEPERSDNLHALALYRQTSVDFADAALAVAVKRRHCGTIFSFDRHFKQLPVQMLDPVSFASY